MTNHFDLHRLVTRNDMNGVACAALLHSINKISEVAFTHPRDIESGKFVLEGSDITANLPYNEKVHLAFSNHLEKGEGQTVKKENLIVDSSVLSTGRVIYNYYGGKEKFNNLLESAVVAADKSVAAKYTAEEVLHPQKWDLLGFILDSQSGLEKHGKLVVFGDELTKKLAHLCGVLSIDEILETPEVKEWVDLYFTQEKMFDEQIKKCSTIYNKLLVVDLTKEYIIYAGNRFRIYALYPNINISAQSVLKDNGKTALVSVGKSIFDRSCEIDIGNVMRQHGGGGHVNAGSCQMDISQYENVLSTLVKKLS